MSHANARLTPAGRKILVDRVAAGTPQAHVAAQMGLSRATVAKWWHRWLAEGDDGLQNRSSRPKRSPTRTKPGVEKRICRLRTTKRWGPRRIGMELAMPASTVHRVLVRHELQRLRWIDRPTGTRIRRYEREHPGELIHLDIKKVGQIPPGGGWKALGRGKVKKRRRVGYTYLHVAVDDHSRVAYVEAHDDEKAATLVAFWGRARLFFRNRGMTIDEVLTDNAKNFTSNAFADALGAQAIKHRRIKPYRPQTNGKVERFNRTLADEFLYARMFRSENERRRRLDRWVHDYNHHRNHTAIGGPPASRVHNVCGHYIRSVE
ncbi:MAG: IS481 family transposase [Actinomycetota bacterium]